MLEKYPDLFAQYPKIIVDPGRLAMLDVVLAEIQRYQESLKQEAEASKRYNDMLSAAKVGNLELLKQYYYNWPEDYVNKKIAQVDAASLRKIHELEQEVRISTIKQFHGKMRIEHIGGDDYICGLIKSLEVISGTVCDVCGKPGTLRGEQWLYTSCDEHVERDMHIKWYEEAEDE